jgi:N-acetylneuraminic acid mutarotase
LVLALVAMSSDGAETRLAGETGAVAAGLADGGQWEESSPATSPDSRFGHSMANLNGNLYIFGGMVPGDPNPQNELWEYDYATSTWSQVSAAGSLPPGRHSHTAVAQDSKMLIYGGAGAGGRPQSDLWEYNADGNNWNNVFAQCPPSARHSHSAALTEDGRMVVVGGVGSGGNLNDTWIFDLVSNSWTQGADFPGPAGDTYGSNAAAVGNQVTVFGSSNEVYVYDAVLDRWETHTVSGDAPSPRHSSSSAQAGPPESGGSVLTRGLGKK